MRMLRQFIRDERGIAMVEFAFVGPPFLLLLLAIIELGLTLFTQSVLDGATRSAARLIRTGQVVAAGTSSTAQIAAFQTELCNDLSMVLVAATCGSNVIFDVEIMSFGTISFTSCNANPGTPASPPTTVPCNFNPGTGGQVVGVKVTYARPYIVPWVGACMSGGDCWTGPGSQTMSNMGTGTMPLSSVVIFQNEP